MSFFKKVAGAFDFNIDENQEEKLETKENRVQKEVKEPIKDLNKVKKTQVVNQVEKKVRPEQESNQKYDVVVFKPYDVYDCTKIGDWISKDIVVILNLEDVDTSLGRRVIDFVWGSIYIKGADLTKISKSLYICVPPNMNVKIDDLGYSEGSHNDEELVPEEIKPKYSND